MLDHAMSEAAIRQSTQGRGADRSLLPMDRSLLAASSALVVLDLEQIASIRIAAEPTLQGAFAVEAVGRQAMAAAIEVRMRA